MKKRKAPRPTSMPTTMRMARKHSQFTEETVTKSIRVSTSNEVAPDTSFDLAVNVNVDNILEQWETEAEKFSSSLTTIIAKSYAMLDVISSADKALKESGVDPAAEIVSKTLMEDVQKVLDQRFLLAVVDFLYEDRSSEGGKLIEKMIEPLSTRVMPKQNRLKETLEKLVTKSADSPYGEPTTVGVTQHYE